MAFSVEQMKHMRIGVLYGGLSSERDVSLKTGAAVAEALSALGYEVKRIDVDKDLPAALRREQVEVAFVAVHGRYGEDGCLQGLLESMLIPYTGSGVLASAAGMDKVFAKQVFRAHGIKVAEDRVFRDVAAFEERPQLGFAFPVVVKPSGEGSSVGVKIVKTEGALLQAVKEAAKFKGQILIERYVKGREVQAAVLDDEALGAIEVVPANEFYDYAAKYTSGTTQYLFPAPVPEQTYQRICQAALEAHRALGCAGATRSDLILGEDGEVYLLEVNTLPGMTATSLLPKIAAGRGIEFKQLCERILLGASLKA